MYNFFPIYKVFSIFVVIFLHKNEKAYRFTHNSLAFYNVSVCGIFAGGKC